VIADNLNELTLPLTNPQSFSVTPQAELIAMIFGYSAQIFADFAGYSLIAIGIAKLFGFRLPDNFNKPYLAQSISDFWRRWHISLSTWLREYLFIPLGGSRMNPSRTYLNLLIVMVLGGIWHGADWKFAVWGLFHGTVLVIERYFRLDKTYKGWMLPPRIFITFLLVTFGWLLFRLNNFGDLLLLFNALTGPSINIQANRTALPHTVTILLLSTVILLFHIPRNLISINENIVSKLKIYEPYYIGGLFAIVLMASGNQHAFIYFQF